MYSDKNSQSYPRSGPNTLATKHLCHSHYRQWRIRSLYNVSFFIAAIHIVIVLLEYISQKYTTACCYLSLSPSFSLARSFLRCNFLSIQGMRFQVSKCCAKKIFLHFIVPLSSSHLLGLSHLWMTRHDRQQVRRWATNHPPSRGVAWSQSHHPKCGKLLQALPLPPLTNQNHVAGHPTHVWLSKSSKPCGGPLRFKGQGCIQQCQGMSPTQGLVGVSPEAVLITDQ